jgi:hypothetical protein
MTAPDIHLKIVATNRSMCGEGPFPASRLTQDSRKATCGDCLEMVGDRSPHGQGVLFEVSH